MLSRSALPQRQSGRSMPIVEAAEICSTCLRSSECEACVYSCYRGSMLRYTKCSKRLMNGDAFLKTAMCTCLLLQYVTASRKRVWHSRLRKCTSAEVESDHMIGSRLSDFAIHVCLRPKRTSRDLKCTLNKILSLIMNYGTLNYCYAYGTTCT